MRAIDVAAAGAAAVWAYLVAGHGGFWRFGSRLPAHPREPSAWPPVAVVVPARDEAAVLPRTLPTLLAQDYPGRLGVWLVDDGSTDGTTTTARAVADGCAARVPLHLLAAPPPPPGWAGKVHALHHGLRAPGHDDGGWVLFTDADIAHHPGSLRRLVAHALADRRELVSVMARLRTETAWERALVPAFVYFFAQLYPFPRVARPSSRTAAAAGGCVLVARDALERAGGPAAVRGALIDDVALGRLVKRAGARTWLGVAGPDPEVRSVRAYPDLRSLWDMVARSAYVQLRRSPALLAGTVVGLGLVYLVPPAAAVAGLAGRRPRPALLGLGAWTAMAVTQGPVLRLYGLSRWRGVALPAVAALYAAMTVDSARRHHLGRGTPWKDRTAPS
ncbi:glycosyltransferase [Actinomycetospora sp. TBRC 11914]|uniref:glycosyltransferase n=1 Tax=Actinomycetospora sp. TBRC 11914 TaxID=2729387 RepID=UPI00145C8A51|nr:glycosyltransferase [Actinomycetospora sp. TBRC 11914]NMO89478.1 glycosyltransferase [Actinomycetospora sp. TBRC 11914]